MNASDFELKLIDLYWLSNKIMEETDDLCAHGHVFVRIGNEIVSNKENFEITVSATALYLLRTLKEDYKKDDYASQLLPCCGHTLIGDNKNVYTVIIGCPSGIDWTIKHIENNMIKHTTQKGEQAIIDKEAYKKIVLEFADQIEDFYNQSSPKKSPLDDSNKLGYNTFWKEWRKLRNEWD